MIFADSARNTEEEVFGPAVVGTTCDAGAQCALFTDTEGMVSIATAAIRPMTMDFELTHAYILLVCKYLLTM